MRKVLSEEEIVSSWIGETAKPVVSVSCVSYNHSSFIEDALEGFLIQETDFPFEILIHDDASTDGTADIIKKYQSLYPNLIKPIFQSENQYSKGFKNPNVRFNYPRAAGRYIATCEGDDFWTDPHKLQKQKDFLDDNPDCVMCGHSLITIDEKVLESNLEMGIMRVDNIEIDEYDITLRSVHLSVIMFRNILSYDLDDFTGVYGGDRILRTLLLNNGNKCFVDNINFSVYRKNRGGVWGYRSKLSKMRERIKTRYRVIELTKGTKQYFQSIDEAIYRQHQYEKYQLNSNGILYYLYQVLIHTLDSIKQKWFFAFILFRFKLVYAFIRNKMKSM